MAIPVKLLKTAGGGRSQHLFPSLLRRSNISQLNKTPWMVQRNSQNILCILAVNLGFLTCNTVKQFSAKQTNSQLRRVEGTFHTAQRSSEFTVFF